MSKGYGGVARMITQDETTIIYEYYVYDLNKESNHYPQAIFDGLITIDKHSFVEPELHRKLKKMPNGKKKEITKRIHRTIDYGALISANAIQVENSRYCWCITEDGIGFGAMCLLRKIYDAYQESGIILETAEFMI